MLEQWRADMLLRADKVYSGAAYVDLSGGAEHDYQVETDDSSEFFLLDVRVQRRSQKAVFGLRYQRNIVLARMCTRGEHTNPDESEIGAPHFHRYDEQYHDKFATEVGPFKDNIAAFSYFCKQINLPEPSLRRELG